MKRKAVESSNIASVGYKVTERTLEVRFNTGSIYQYTDVPKVVYEGLRDAESKGQFFYQYIRGVFDYTRIK
jgi:hypothetical protein